MSVTSFHTSFNKGNKTAIIHNNMSQFGWGPFLGLNAHGPFRYLVMNRIICLAKLFLIEWQPFSNEI